MINARNITLCAIFFLLQLCVPYTTLSQPTFFGINCGGRLPYANHLGYYFVADSAYSSSLGYGYVNGYEGAGPSGEPIGGGDGFFGVYKTFRYDLDSYLIDLPYGHYAVTLFLAELTHHWHDFRIFSVIIEDDTVVHNLDIFAEVGRAYGYPVRHLTECVDGQLNIDFIPSLDCGIVNGILVEFIQPDSNPPQPIQNFSIVGGYMMNILSWDPVIEPDVAGYLVYRRLPEQQWELCTDHIFTLSRYLDCNVVPFTEYEYKIVVQDLWGNMSSPSDSLRGTPIINQMTQLPVYNMEITDENLYLLNINIWSEDYVDVDLELTGLLFPGSGVRYRGNTTRYFSKKNYKLNLPGGQPFNNRDKLNLMAEMADPSMVKDKVVYELFDRLDCLSPLTERVHLRCNDTFIGVYLDVEQVDEYFLERNGLSESGNMYRCESDLSVLPCYSAYQEQYIKVTNENSDWYDIIDFIEWVNYSSQIEFHEEAGDRFAIDDYIDNYIALIAPADIDIIYHNYYIYANPDDGLWHFISKDHNQSLYYPYCPINYGTQAGIIPEHPFWNKLMDRVLDDQVFRYAYCKKLERFLTDDLTVQSFHDLINSEHEAIAYDAVKDVFKKGWESSNSFFEGRDELLTFADQRVNYLLDEIPGFITDPNLAPYFSLNEIQSDNQSTIADEMGDYDPWIEIYNRAPVGLDLEDFTLLYGAETWTLPAEAVVDNEGFLVLWLDGESGEGPLHAPFTINQTAGNIILQSPTGYLSDSTTFPALNADQVWGREVDGSGTWTTNLVPTPGSTNNPLPDPSELVINEFLADNETNIADSAGEFDDWIEIYNPGDIVIPVGGLYLTDDLERPTRWIIPDTTISPHGYLFIWADDDPEQGSLHATFKLSANGEDIGIFDRDGFTPIDTFSFGPQGDDISCGRYPDGSDNWFQLMPTPELPNMLLGSLSMTLTPATTPIIILPAGGSFDFNIEVGNQTTAFQSFDIWTDISLPSGEKIPILTVTGLMVSGITTIERDRTQAIPGNAPSGSYHYNGYIGVYPTIIYTYDQFDFLKTGDNPDGEVGGLSGWLCTGESFDDWLSESNVGRMIPEEFSLSQNFPNPFNPTTVIGYQLPVNSLVNLTVYDISGRKVTELINGWRDAGIHEVTFDASYLGSGIYLYRLEAGDFTASGKMLLLK